MTTFKEALAWYAHEAKIGYREKPVNLTKYAAMAGHANGEPWCATFGVAGAHETGLALPDGADTASCALNEVSFKRAGRLSATPHLGDFGFVYFPNMKPRPRVAHQVFVWKISSDGRWVFTIEGNSNDDGAREGYEVCFRKRLARRATGTVGLRSYGRPYYTALPAKPLVQPAPPKLTAQREDDHDMQLTDKIDAKGPAARRHLTAMGMAPGYQPTVQEALLWGYLIGADNSARLNQIEEKLDRILGEQAAGQ